MEVSKIVNATTLAEVVDLNASSSTGIKTLRVFSPDLDTYESLLPFNPDVPGITVLKQQDKVAVWTLWLRIPAQTNMANLISKVNSVGNGFYAANRAFMLQREGESTPRYFNIVPTRISGSMTGDMDPVHFNAQKMLPIWKFNFRTHPYAQSSSTPPWY